MNSVSRAWPQPEHEDIVAGVFAPVLAKYSKSFSLIDCVSVGVDRVQRNFEPMRKQLEIWQRSELTDVTAKVVIYETFVEGKLEAPKHLTRHHISICWSAVSKGQKIHRAVGATPAEFQKLVARTT